jgi:hypothetical protein
LWILAGLVTLGIYSTAVVARSISTILRSAGMLEAVFAVGVLLVLGTVIVFAFTRGAGGPEVAVVLGVAAVYLLLFVRIEIPEERTHLIEYGVVAMLLLEALKERASQGASVPMPAVTAMLATVVAGAVDEGIQWAVPNRVFDLRDVGFNALAGAMAVLSVLAVRWVRQRRAP